MTLDRALSFEDVLPLAYLAAVRRIADAYARGEITTTGAELMLRVTWTAHFGPSDPELTMPREGNGRAENATAATPTTRSEFARGHLSE